MGIRRCTEKVRNTQVFRDEVYTSTLVAPEIVCPNEEFLLRLDGLIQLCTEGGQGFITIDSIEAMVVNGAANFVGVVNGTNPPGTYQYFISPDEQQMFVTFNSAQFESNADVPGSQDRYVLDPFFGLLLEAGVESGPITVSLTLRGFSSLTEECRGPFGGDYELTHTAEVLLVEADHLCCQNRNTLRMNDVDRSNTASISTDGEFNQIVDNRKASMHKRMEEVLKSRGES